MICSHKRIFFTEERAYSFKRFLENQFQRVMRVYKCNACPYWHLTKQLEPKPQNYD